MALLEDVLLNVWCCFDKSQITSQSVYPGVIYSSTNGIFVPVMSYIFTLKPSMYEWSACSQLIYLAHHT